MIKRAKSILLSSNYLLFIFMLLLLIISHFAIYSGSYDVISGKVSYYPYSQLKIAIFGLFLFFFIPFIGYNNLIKFSIVFYILGCLILIFILFKGTTVMGAKRWLSLGGLRVQPSEFFKFVWVLVLGKVFSNLKSDSLSFFDIIKKAVWVIPPFILVYLEPDLGTALTYLVVWGFIIMFLGIKIKTFIAIFIIVLISMPVLWVNMGEYQKGRVFAFLNPEKYAGNKAYQAIQSKIAVGSGGLYGKGYLKGTQVHLRFMPERHTDFIFSVINEEFGLLGGATVITLFFFLISLIILISAESMDPGGKITCIAVASFIFFQFFVNIGMTIGLAPVVGIPIPFISFGGSSLITFMSMVAVVNSIYIGRYKIDDW